MIYKVDIIPTLTFGMPYAGSPPLPSDLKLGDKIVEFINIISDNWLSIESIGKMNGMDIHKIWRCFNKALESIVGVKGQRGVFILYQRMCEGGLHQSRNGSFVIASLKMWYFTLVWCVTYWHSGISITVSLLVLYIC